jgi:hypothetical protein
MLITCADAQSAIAFQFAKVLEQAAKVFGSLPLAEERGTGKAASTVYPGTPGTRQILCLSLWW